MEKTGINNEATVMFQENINGSRKTQRIGTALSKMGSFFNYMLRTYIYPSLCLCIYLQKWQEKRKDAAQRHSWGKNMIKKEVKRIRGSDLWEEQTEPREKVAASVWTCCASESSSVFYFYFLFISLSNRVLLKKAIARFPSLTEATHKTFPVHDPDQVYQERNITQKKNKTITVLV